MSSGNRVFSGFFSSERQVPFEDTHPIQGVGCMERRETGNQSGDGGKGRGSKRIYEATWRLSRDPGRWRVLNSEVDVFKPLHLRSKKKKKKKKEH